jgi:hypothetical protein
MTKTTLKFKAQSIFSMDSILTDTFTPATWRKSIDLRIYNKEGNNFMLKLLVSFPLYKININFRHTINFLVTNKIWVHYNIIIFN